MLHATEVAHKFCILKKCFLLSGHILLQMTENPMVYLPFFVSPCSLHGHLDHSDMRLG